MSEIRCPHCGTVFTVDESGYAELVKQVRDAEFERDMAERERLLQAAHASAVAAAEARVRGEKDRELAERESQIAQLKAQAAASAEAQELAVRSAVAEARHECDALEARLEQERAASRLAQETSQREAAERAARQEADMQARLAKRDARIAALEQQISSQAQTAEAERQLAVATATSKAQLRVVELEGKVARAASEREQAEAAFAARLAEQAAARDQQLRDKDDEIARLRDQRARLTTKLVGESLEQHCEMEFNRWRATAFRGAEFHKDNDVVEGSKGDYVYRELDEDGVEILSIMFEMKTEEDDATHHHKNEDFFRKLDRDRRNKGCEYAVLVSMLEPDNEFYNGGIADVSYAYPKMYVIRPQLFVPMITILRNAALNGLEARRELAQVRQQNIDITHFEERMEAFKLGFSKNYELASRKFQAAIDEIDRSIAHLQKVRDSLTASERQLRLANDKAEGLTIRKLTWGNPTMREAFAEARERAEAETAETGEPDEATYEVDDES